MKPRPNDIQLFSLPASAPEVCNDDLATTGAEIKEYESILYKIAISFGFSNSETMNIVQQVCSCFDVHYADQQDGACLKIRLSKSMVHQCIFKLSSQLFSQSTDAEKLRVTDMPLSIHSAFIFHDIIGFNE